ncbi:uncharacterized protein LOC103833349 [Brassica rapa]|uniref:uncharacterized protein LOC103833349 n=1 Tax=Brassica campestris TaxID=3711 RepID=UPI00142DE782|nr:uncharacterized protein LOC103833349 [Brassica rapa]
MSQPEFVSETAKRSWFHQLKLSSSPFASPHISLIFRESVLSGLCVCSSTIARGNQRERDRERAQARGNHKPKQPKNDGLTPEQRRERDARALQEKAARKAGQSMGEGNHDHFLCVGGKIKN